MTNNCQKKPTQKYAFTHRKKKGNLKDTKKNLCLELCFSKHAIVDTRFLNGHADGIQRCVRSRIKDIAKKQEH